jgi:hypothetical protein
VPDFWLYTGISAVWSAIILALGVLVWRRYQWQFPEMV